MNAQNEIISTADFDARREVIVKWIGVLFVCQIASVVTTALAGVAALNAVAVWAARGVSIAAIAALFHLAEVHERYRKAAILSAIALVGGIVTGLLKLESLSLVLSICSIAATYQELHAHAELTEPKDEKLSRRWRALFWYEIVAGLFAGFFATVAVMVAAFAQIDQDTIVSLAVIAAAVVTAIVALVRVLYLKQTLALYQE